MNAKYKQVLLAVTGAGLVIGGHKLMKAELGTLGVPHAIGAALIGLALKA